MFVLILSNEGNWPHSQFSLTKKKKHSIIVLRKWATELLKFLTVHNKCEKCNIKNITQKLSKSLWKFLFRLNWVSHVFSIIATPMMVAVAYREGKHIIIYSACAQSEKWSNGASVTFRCVDAEFLKANNYIITTRNQKINNLISKTIRKFLWLKNKKSKYNFWSSKRKETNNVAKALNNKVAISFSAGKTASFGKGAYILSLWDVRNVSSDMARGKARSQPFSTLYCAPCCLRVPIRQCNGSATECMHTHNKVAKIPCSM